MNAQKTDICIYAWIIIFAYYLGRYHASFFAFLKNVGKYIKNNKYDKMLTDCAMASIYCKEVLD